MANETNANANAIPSGATKTLKPVSDMEREFLSLLKETPSQHQAQVLAIKGGKKSPGHEQGSRNSNGQELLKTQEFIAKALLKGQNRETLSILANQTEDLHELCKRLEEKDRRQKVSSIKWKDECYFLELEIGQCTICGHDTILHQLVTLCKVEEKPTELQSRQYVPVNTITNGKLERIIQRHYIPVNFCPHCF